MPVVLAIDTSTRWAGVGLAGAGEPVEHIWHSEQNHGAELMDNVLDILGQRDLSVSDVECVAVAIG